MSNNPNKRKDTIFNILVLLAIGFLIFTVVFKIEQSVQPVYNQNEKEITKLDNNNRIMVQSNAMLNKSNLFLFENQILMNNTLDYLTENQKLMNNTIYKINNLSERIVILEDKLLNSTTNN